MGVTAQEVKDLREKTGAGVMECKHALVEAGGDQKKAILMLREKGQAKAQKKRSRVAREGVIAHYVHAGSKQAALVELNCETDFVARNSEFQRLAREICMHVVACRPLAVRREDLPKDIVETERNIYLHQVQSEGKPERIAQKIVQGRMEKFYAEACLLEQPYSRDETKTIGALIDEAISKLGEKVEIGRFVRMAVGEE